MIALSPFKVCTRCHKRKRLTSFGLCNGRPRSNCKRCAAKRTRAWAKANPEKYQQHVKRRNITRYGITPEQRDQMIIAQAGLCKICEKPMDLPQIDHCHTTGAVRGLLCRSCNTSLGGFGDDIDVLRRAVAYLEQHTCAALQESLP